MSVESRALLELVAGRSTSDASTTLVENQVRSVCRLSSSRAELFLVRSRRWLVEEVDLDVEAGRSAVVSLACADDDAQLKPSRSTGTTNPTG